MRDNFDRTCTLAHNGTIFDCPALDGYVQAQEGWTDSEQFYVHTNYADSLYVKQTDGTAIFSTVPLTRTGWEPLPLTTLLVYKDGKRIFQGADHGYAYQDDPNDMRLIFVDYAEL